MCPTTSYLAIFIRAFIDRIIYGEYRNVVSFALKLDVNIVSKIISHSKKNDCEPHGQMEAGKTISLSKFRK